MPARRPLCRLGWADPTKIPVDKIAEEWRAQSSKGRYESAMWREAGLEEPGANLNAGAAAVVAEAVPRSTTSRPAASSRASGGSQLAPSQQSSQHTREGRPWGRH